MAASTFDNDIMLLENQLPWKDVLARQHGGARGRHGPQLRRPPPPERRLLLPRPLQHVHAPGGPEEDVHELRAKRILYEPEARSFYLPFT